MRRFLERGGGWVAGQFLLLACLLALAALYPGTGPVAWRFVGVLFLVIAAAVGVAGAKALGRNLTPFPKPADHAELVRHGIYAKIRHPLYSAVILAGFGWALVWLSWPALLAAAALLPFFHAKSCREEGFLRQKFPGYREYETRTCRFIPWIY
ncbi:MAG: isoprenylcysteine carboxylmethyltransferase family protein [Verrucomicrobiae bacterium]